GESGTTIFNRLGYRRLVADIDANLIGALFTSDLTRLGRNSVQMLSLLEVMEIHDVILVVDGKPHDMHDLSVGFAARIRALVGELDNKHRRATLWRGMIALAKAGHAVSAPPRGYVAGPNGTWEIDPDPAVREAIATVFRIFLQERSLHRTLR